MKPAIGILGLSLLALPAHAEGLMQQFSGVWTLTSGAEQMPDGTKKVPWSAGELILDPSGPSHSLCLAPTARQKVRPIRAPQSDRWSPTTAHSPPTTRPRH